MSRLKAIYKSYRAEYVVYTITQKIKKSHITQKENLVPFGFGTILTQIERWLLCFTRQKPNHILNRQQRQCMTLSQTLFRSNCGKSKTGTAIFIKSATFIV